MSTHSPGLFLMNKKQEVGIIKKFKEKSEGIMPFVTFSISLGGMYTSLFFIGKHVEEEANLKITPGIVGGVFAYPFNVE